MDDMDTGSMSAFGSENRELSEEDVALSPTSYDMVRQPLIGHSHIYLKQIYWKNKQVHFGLNTCVPTLT